MNNKIMPFLSLILACFLCFSFLPLPVQADNIPSDWRRITNTPTLTFYDADGNRIKELTEIYAGDSALSFDASTVSYSKANIEQLDYSCVDLSFSLVDYECRIEDELALPSASDFTAELTFGDTTVGIDSSEPDQIYIDRNGSSYLKLVCTFSQINPFLENNNQVSLFIQYWASDDSGNNKYKGNLSYEFSQMILPLEPEEVETEDQEKMEIEIILPEKEEADSVSIRSETPYIIITERTINDGGSSVSAGESFTLTLTGQNSHSKLSIDNVLMQVDYSDDLQLEYPSNTFYIGDIKKNGSFEQTLTFSVAPTASSGNHSISLHFNYEYIDDETRRYDSIDHEFSVSVSQPLRFALSPVDTLQEYACGEEHSIYSSCANLSHSDLYNVSAVLNTDLASPQKTIYLGNLRSGEVAAAHFSVLSSEAGSYAASITYYYEDQYGQMFSESSDFSLTFITAPTEEEEWQSSEETTTLIPAVSNSVQSPTDHERSPYFLSGVFIILVLLFLFCSLMWKLLKGK